MNTTAVIILAAGASSRLGQPKQLLAWEGSTLLQHAVNVATTVAPNPIVVLGAHLSQMQEALNGAAVQIVNNKRWEEGIASSIRAGLTTAMDRSAELQQVLFMVCDQPYVSVSLFQELLLAQVKSSKGIIACAYSGTVGIPALFTRPLFAQLLDLEGDEGAKKLILQHSGDIYAVPFPMGHVDIDTAEEYEKLMG